MGVPGPRNAPNAHPRKGPTSKATGADRIRRALQEIQIGRTGYFQGVTGGTLSVAGGMSTVLKSAGLTISRYSMSGE